ncbi:GntR family transcriptional regulator [Halobacillus litoralis]|uniref:GntR family transcriptional regulator n=1 Tax=Halobacillus litoralis TaxID=45668 RepID=UPI001CD566A8|nr:GntR family transcriptional regulator [Halobacillus litoralis]MCA1023623.1 GntR family transcriptional regulator [Halobacillus litoralis]
MLKKNHPLPMYYQIEEFLKREISEGTFQAGDMIPSERELSERFQVSRMTVRQAVSNMVNDGILYREKGRGTFVAEKKIEQPLKGLTSFTEDMKLRGMTSASRLLSFDVMQAPQDIASKLKLEEGEVYAVKRIRFADRQAMAVETSFLPVSLLPDLTEDIVQGSMYEYMEHVLDLTISHARQEIEARAADENEGTELQIEAGAPVLHIERCSYLDNGIPFEVVKSTYRADRYKFISDIVR